MSRSFFEKLTGSVRVDNDDFIDEETTGYSDYIEPHNNRHNPYSQQGYAEPPITTQSSYEAESNEEVGELPVDVYHTDNAIFVRAMTSGVRKNDLDIVVNRDQVQISGSRSEKSNLPPENYIHQELYWGSFSRLIDLPYEIDIEQATATEEAGLLTLKLPKLNKNRTTRLRVE